VGARVRLCASVHKFFSIAHQVLHASGAQPRPLLM